MRRAGQIILAIILILTGILWVNNLTQPVNSYSQEIVELRIESGASSSEIGDILYQHGLIKSRLIFSLILKLQGLDDDLKAGFYALKPAEDLVGIINKLVNGEIATFRVTIPEGFTVKEIAGRLVEHTPYSVEEFLNQAKNNSFKKEFLAEQGIGNKYALEGFLYPDTYFIPKDYQAEDILKVFLDEFEVKWWTRLQEEAKDREYTPYEIVTIASMIEAEAKLDEEKPLIAAVIYNRLDRDMLLQIDASIQYSLPARKGRVLYRDLSVDSLYNTYRYPGLPPGPVSSPGDKSIEAALYPAKTDYLFYFALEDGSHVFSRTYQEHLRGQKKLRD